MLRHDPEADWSEFQQEFQVTLPRDYREFVSAYGSCYINEFLVLFHPLSPEGGLNLHEKVARYSHDYKYRVDNNPEYSDFPYFTTPGGYFPVGHDHNGATWLVATDGGTELERVMIEDWTYRRHFEMNFTDFLYLALRGELEDPQLFNDADVKNPKYRLIWP